MVKAAIFDLNGIFLQSPLLSTRIEKDFGVPVADFVLKLQEVMSKVRQPSAAPAFTYWQPVLLGWGITISEKEFWDYWFKAEKPSWEMIDFARDLREKGIKVFILSNNFRERSEYYEEYGWIHDAVDKVYFSWKTGFVKPDPEAWKLILTENNLLPEECVYFDDQKKNVDVAEKLGMHSFAFTDEVHLKKIINNLLQ